MGNDAEGRELYKANFKLTKSVMNFCECNPSADNLRVISEDPPYKCDRVVLEPVEVRTNEELTYDADLGECNLFFDLTIENTDFTETPPFVVTEDGPTRESIPATLDDCCLQVLQFIDDATFNANRHFLGACTKTNDRSASTLTYSTELN